MRVWIDMTASAHPLVFRPLVELMRGARRRGRDHGARLRADAAADRAARDDARRRSATTAGARGCGKARQLSRGSARSGSGRKGATSTSRSPTGRTS